MTHPSNGNRNGHRVADAHAYIHEDALVIHAFTETDPTVVGLVADAEDPESAVHSCLQVGARAIGMAEVTLDTAVVERSFDSLSERLTSQLASTVKGVDEAARGLLDAEDGELTRALGEWSEQVESLFDGAFDPDSKKSVLGKLNTLLEEARQAQLEALRRLVDPHDEDGPLARQRREIIKTVKEETAVIKAAVAEVSEKIAVRKSEAELLEHTAIKGMAFEDIAHAEVAAIVEPFGDVAEPTGTTVGAAGTKRGDMVVTLNTDDTRGHSAAYVLEVKDRKVGLRSILAELDEAEENREALASIAVFSRDQHRGSGPSRTTGRAPSWSSTRTTPTRPPCGSLAFGLAGWFAASSPRSPTTSTSSGSRT